MSKFTVQIVFGVMVSAFVFWLLKPSLGSFKKSAANHVSHDTPEVKNQELSSTVKTDFEKAQEGYLKEIAAHPIEMERTYNREKMLSDLEVAATEASRKHQVKMEIIRESNDGEEPAPTDEERELFAELMASEGLKSVYSH